LIDKQDDSLLGDELFVLLLEFGEVLEAVLDLGGSNLLLLEVPLGIAELESGVDLLDMLHVACPGGNLLGLDAGVWGPVLLLLEEGLVVSIEILETKLEISQKSITRCPCGSCCT